MVGFFTSCAIIVIWSYAVLAIGTRRWGYGIATVMSLLALVVPLVHIMPKGHVDGSIAGSSDPYFFVWTLLALTATSILAFTLAGRGIFGKL